MLQFGKSNSHNSKKFEWPSFSAMKSVDNLEKQNKTIQYNTKYEWSSKNMFNVSRKTMSINQSLLE